MLQSTVMIREYVVLAGRRAVKERKAVAEFYDAIPPEKRDPSANEGHNHFIIVSENLLDTLQKCFRKFWQAETSKKVSRKATNSSCGGFAELSIDDLPSEDEELEQRSQFVEELAHQDIQFEITPSSTDHDSECETAVYHLFGAFQDYRDNIVRTWQKYVRNERSLLQVAVHSRLLYLRAMKEQNEVLKQFPEITAYENAVQHMIPGIMIKYMEKLAACSEKFEEEIMMREVPHMWGYHILTTCKESATGKTVSLYC